MHSGRGAGCEPVRSFVITQMGDESNHHIDTAVPADSESRMLSDASQVGEWNEAIMDYELDTDAVNA